MSVQDEMRHLKRMIEELKSAQDTQLAGGGAQAMLPSGRLGAPALEDAFEQLVLSGVDKRFALDLIRKVAFELGEEASASPDHVTDQLAAEIMGSTEVASALGELRPGGAPMGAPETGPRVIALVGPTGVGKTTTVAKIASEAILKRNLKVGLVNLDTYKVAAFDQLGTYAKILNVPFRSCATAEELRAALADYRSLDLVLVDTTGRSQKDPAALNATKEVLAASPEATAHLVLSVTTRDGELYDMAGRFAMFRPQGIIVSKLDEGTTYGAIYNVCQKARLPLSYFTTGQRVPEDIEEATRERVASLILDI
jgi:flagellar biosynthesis protein FlhF